MYRRDANEGIFLARELEHIIAKVYRKKYADLRCREHFPVSFEGGPGVETVTYRLFDRVGLAQIGYGFPRIQAFATEHTVKVKPITASYSFTFQEARFAEHTGTPLSSELAMATKRAIAEKENDIAYLGDAESGLLGAFTHPNIGIQIAPNPISSASTADQIIAVYNVAINGVKTFSKGVESVTTMLSPLTQYTYISTTRIPDTDSTILDFLQKAHPGVEFDWCNECAGAGTNGRDILYAYVRNEDNLVLRITQEFEQLEQVWDGKETIVNCHERIGGIQMMYASALITEL